VNAAADVTPILQTVFLLIRKVDDDTREMFMNYFSSFQLLLNQENEKQRDCSSWHKGHVNKLSVSEKKPILHIICKETPILFIRREKCSLANMHQHPTSGHYVDEEENEQNHLCI
jgi:hypothetical protein